MRDFKNLKITKIKNLNNHCVAYFKSIEDFQNDKNINLKSGGLVIIKGLKPIYRLIN